MKRNIVCFALALGIGSSATAQTISFVKAIDVGSVVQAPTGIQFYNGDLFVNGFTTQNLAKVTAPLSVTPTVTNLATLNTITWGSGRGPQGLEVNPANGNLYSVGDDGTNGDVFVVNQAGTILNTLTYTANRTVSGALWGTTPTMILTRSITSAPFTAPDPASGTTTPITALALATTPNNAAHRDVVVVGDTVYYTRTGTTSDTLSKYTGGTSGTAAGYAASLVFSGSQINSVAMVGLGIYRAPTKTYVVMADLSTLGNAALRFFNPANSDAQEITFTDANLAVGGLRDVCFGNIGGTDYAFVTRSGGSPVQAVLVYSITPTVAAAQDWQLY